MKKQHLLLVMLSVLLTSTLYFSCKKEPVQPVLSQEDVQKEMFARLDQAYAEYVQNLEAQGIVMPRSCGNSAQVKVVVSAGSPLVAVVVRNSCGTILGSYSTAGTYFVCASPGEVLNVAATGNPGTTFTVKLNRQNWCASCPGAPAKCVGPVSLLTVTTPNTPPPYVPVFVNYLVTGCNYECE